MDICSVYHCSRMYVIQVSLLERMTLIVTAVTMILRVWALYNRSRLVLITLLVLFFLEIISFIIGYAVHSDPRTLLGM